MAIPQQMEQVLHVARTLNDEQLQAMGEEFAEHPVPAEAMAPISSIVKESAELRSWYTAFKAEVDEFVFARFGMRAGRTPWNGVSASIQGAGWAAVMFPAGVIDTTQYVECCRPWHKAWTSDGRFAREEVKSA